MKNVANMLVFQAAWFACILGAANGYWWVGPVAVLPVIGLFVAMMNHGHDRGRIVLFLVGFGCLGAVIEWTMTQFEVYTFAVQSTGLGVAWMAALWIAFATTFPLSLRWVVSRPSMAALCGFVFGPLSFLAGEKLGAISILEPRVGAFAVLGLTWSVVMFTTGSITTKALRPQLSSGTIS